MPRNIYFGREQLHNNETLWGSMQEIPAALQTSPAAVKSSKGKSAGQILSWIWRLGRFAFFPLMVSIGGLIKRVAYPYCQTLLKIQKKPEPRCFISNVGPHHFPWQLIIFPSVLEASLFPKGWVEIWVSFSCLRVWHRNTWPPYFWYFLGLPQLKTFFPLDVKPCIPHFDKV